MEKNDLINELGGIISNSSATSIGKYAASSLLNQALRPRFVANGNDLILSINNTPGKEKNEYIIFKNANVKEMGIKSSINEYVEITLTISAYDGFNTKVIELPKHIPVEQHARYVQGVFDKNE
jgi:hypothetical protein